MSFVSLSHGRLNLPSEASQLNRLPQDGQEVQEVLALLVVAQDGLLGDLRRGPGRQAGGGPRLRRTQAASYLSLLLAQNAKLEIEGHSVFVEGGYEFRSLGGERGRSREKA